MSDWVWGIDVSTKDIVIAAAQFNPGGQHVNGPPITIHARRPEGAVWPAYLKGLFVALSKEIAKLNAHCPPLIVGIEQTTGTFPNPRLFAAWGVAQLAVSIELPDTVTWDWPPKQWRSELQIKKKPSKLELVELARLWMQYVGSDDNEAEAALVALATARKHLQ